MKVLYFKKYIQLGKYHKLIVVILFMFIMEKRKVVEVCDHTIKEEKTP